MDTAWENILGQREPKRRLRRLLETDRLPHALLFSGPEGVGKRRTAEALAAALLCSSPAAGHPCGTCESCRAFSRGIHPDFFFVVPEAVGKRARSIRIEAMRALGSALARPPELAPRQVALIDDAQRMNEAAANSFLKTLEEPTGDVVFLLVTGMRAALLDTIVSRCLEIPFGPLALPELSEVLRRHGVEAEEAAALAALADGSAGRALALHAEGALRRREEAVSLLARLPQIPPLSLWAEGKKWGALSREEAGEWLRSLRLTLRDVLALYGGAAPLYSVGLEAPVAEIAARFSEARVFSMLADVKEAERRLLSSNVNIRLLVEALLLSLAGPVEE
ncbi:MAG: DNA polymerase III subunit delta' [Negativicutes bacterium]